MDFSLQAIRNVIYYSLTTLQYHVAFMYEWRLRGIHYTLCLIGICLEKGLVQFHITCMNAYRENIRPFVIMHVFLSRKHPYYTS